LFIPIGGLPIKSDLRSAENRSNDFWYTYTTNYSLRVWADLRMIYLSVDPKPPKPLSVSLSLPTTFNFITGFLLKTIWAIRSPHFIN